MRVSPISLAFLLVCILPTNTKPIFCLDDDHFKEQLRPSHEFSAHEIDSNGYLLKLFRVRSSKNSNPLRAIMVTHAIFDSADQWVMAGENSLAFKLIDLGFEMFFVNFRGNKFSCRHRVMDPSSAPFWDYSFQEMALQDMRASFEFIISQTGVEKIDLLGHSQGTSAAFAFLSSYPEFHPRIGRFVAVAPVVFMHGFRSQPGYYYWLSTHGVVKALQLAGINHLFTHSWNFDWLTDLVLRRFCRIAKEVCEYIINKIASKSSDQIDFDLLTTYLKHFPSRSSLRSLEHYAQMIKADKKEFTMFDFGEARNQKEYNQPTPPSFPVEGINIPIFLYAGDSDLFSPVENILFLQETLPKAKLRWFKKWGHIEWFCGKHMEHFFDSVIEDLT